MPKKEQKWIYFIAVGSNFGFSVAAGLLLGRYLDSKFDNEEPYFTLIGLILGVFSAITLLIRVLRVKNKDGRK